MSNRTNLLAEKSTANERPAYASDKYLSGTELAAKLGVAAGTVHAWRHKKLIPFVKPPGMNPRYVEREVREFLERWSNMAKADALDGSAK